jgi:hypothetical protein
LFLLLGALLLPGCPTYPVGGQPDDDDASGDDDDATSDDDDTTGDDDDTTGDDDDTTSDDDDTTGDDDDTSPPSPCDEAISRLTNIGCEFWPVDLDNAENFVDNAAGAQFAVAVANTHDSLTAHVEIFINEGGVGSPLLEALVTDAYIPPGDLHTFALPRRDVDGINVTTNVDDGPQTWHSSRAFRVQSDAPIVAYQFNTLDQQYSNDASLLLPTHALGTSHRVLTWPPNAPLAAFGANRTYVTIVAAQDDTVVNVTPSSDIVDGDGVPATSQGVGIAAGQTGTFNLDRYDVLNLETTFLEISFPMDPVPDLSGTTVVSNKPVAVYTGADLAIVHSLSAPVSEDDCCAEHIEQQVLPTRAMRGKFVVSHSAVRNPSNPEMDVYRVIGNGAANVTTSLPFPYNAFSIAAGEFFEFEANQGFTVESDVPLHVAQFLIVGTQAGGIGDSAMLYVPPVEQRRATYTLTTGQGFSENWVVLGMAEGTPVWLDGAPVDSSIGCDGPTTDGTLDGTTYISWTCPISDGVHDVASAAIAADATAPIAATVYGYYSAGSYAYPAGAGLD